MDNSDFIVRYKGAFSKEECENIIAHIHHFEKLDRYFEDFSESKIAHILMRIVFFSLNIRFC